MPPLFALAPGPTAARMERKIRPMKRLSLVVTLMAICLATVLSASAPAPALAGPAPAPVSASVGQSYGSTFDVLGLAPLSTIRGAREGGCGGYQTIRPCISLSG